MRKHVFLIDDDMDEMKIFVEAIKKAGVSFKCTYAASGVQALEMLQYLTPEVIFIDYNMPALNGVEVAKAIRRNGALAHVPLFLYSNQVNPSVEASASEAGILSCIEKPGSLEKLSEVIGKALQLQPV